MTDVLKRGTSKAGQAKLNVAVFEGMYSTRHSGSSLFHDVARLRALPCILWRAEAFLMRKLSRSSHISGGSKEDESETEPHTSVLLPQEVRACAVSFTTIAHTALCAVLLAYIHGQRLGLGLCINIAIHS